MHDAFMIQMHMKMLFKFTAVVGLHMSQIGGCHYRKFLHEITRAVGRVILVGVGKCKFVLGINRGHNVA